MKTTTKRRHNLKLIIITSCIVLILAVFSIYIYIFNGSFFGHNIKPQNDTIINLGMPSESEVVDGKSTKSNSLDNKTTDDSDKPTTPTETDSSSGKLMVATTISAQNQTDVTLQLRFIIGTVASSGNCTLTLTRETVVITKTADIQALASASTCKGFDIPLTDLATGVWNLSMQFSNDVYIGSTTGQVVVK